MVPDRRVPPSVVAGAARSVVEAGAIFSARIDRAVDSFYTPPGTVFVATVVTPLATGDGRTVVPYGAKARGRVASTGSPARPRLVFAIDSLETVAGRTRALVAVRDVQHVDWRGPPLLFVSSRPVPSPGYLLDTVPREEVAPAEIYVPAGALMSLVLQQPLQGP